MTTHSCVHIREYTHQEGYCKQTLSGLLPTTLVLSARRLEVSMDRRGHEKLEGENRARSQRYHGPKPAGKTSKPAEKTSRKAPSSRPSVTPSQESTPDSSSATNSTSTPASTPASTPPSKRKATAYRDGAIDEPKAKKVKATDRRGRVIDKPRKERVKVCWRMNFLLRQANPSAEERSGVSATETENHS